MSMTRTRPPPARQLDARLLVYAIQL